MTFSDWFATLPEAHRELLLADMREMADTVLVVYRDTRRGKVVYWALRHLEADHQALKDKKP